MNQQETNPFDQLSTLKDILCKLRKHHSVEYGKILDLNKRHNLSEGDWKMEEAISSIEKTLNAMETKNRIMNEKINRKSMKIYLFGKVSVGKSKIINALLEERLFTSAASHTTSCFVNIKKSQDSNYTIKFKDKEETYDDIDELQKRIEELSTTHDMDNMKKLNTNETIELFIDIEDNKILKDGTEIVDCPGAGKKTAITDCIKNKALDADIFIFVTSNTLNDEDKTFFRFQSDRSTKPDVFILINQWDNSDNDSDKATQHSKNAITIECQKFLKSFGITDEMEIAERIYFISAMEVFKYRVDKEDISQLNPKALERLESFEKFEDKLSNYVDNPQENKTRRYKVEIELMNKDIIEKIDKFKKDIFDQKDMIMVESYDKIKSDLSELKDLIKSNCVKKKIELTNKMESSLKKIENNDDVIKLEWVNSELEKCKKTLIGDINEFAKSQSKIISEFLKKQESSENKKGLYKKRQPTLKEILNTTVLSQPDVHGDIRNVLSSVTQSLALMPIPSIKAGLAVFTLAAGAAALSWHFNSEKEEQQKTSNQFQIKSLTADATKFIEENLDIIEKENGENIKNIVAIFTEKKHLFTEYWKKIEDIWKVLSQK